MVTPYCSQKPSWVGRHALARRKGVSARVDTLTNLRTLSKHGKFVANQNKSPYLIEVGSYQAIR